MGHKKKEDDQQLRKAFQQYDKDGNGYITAKELREVMEGVGEQLSSKEVQKMINAADSDGDGRIDYTEFVKMMKG